MRFLKAAAAFGVTLGLMFMASVFLLLSVLGPHSPPASKPVELLVYVVCGAAVVAGPVLAARAVWRHGGAP